MMKHDANNGANKMSENKVHKFEIAGLGKAPFKVVGYEFRTYQACPGAPIQVGGSCDYCGTGIKDTFIIQDCEGKQFKVGSTCVYKTRDKGLKRNVDRTLARKRREQRHKREVAKIEQGKEALQSAQVIDALRVQPHPNNWRAEQGDTRLDWAQWMMDNAGNKGKLEVAKYLSTLI